MFSSKWLVMGLQVLAIYQATGVSASSPQEGASLQVRGMPNVADAASHAIQKREAIQDFEKRQNGVDPFHACSSNNDCRNVRNPRNGFTLCLYNQCSFACNPGYHKSGVSRTCRKNAVSCGGTACTATIQGGFTKCVNGRCKYYCDAQAGQAKVTDPVTGFQQCVNVQNADPNNCGAVGTTCPEVYNNIGSSNCQNGRCVTTCPSGTSSTVTNGVLFCR